MCVHNGFDSAVVGGLLPTNNNTKKLGNKLFLLCLCVCICTNQTVGRWDIVVD